MRTRRRVNPAIPGNFFKKILAATGPNSAHYYGSGGFDDVGTIPALLLLNINDGAADKPQRTAQPGGKIMLTWALTFFILAVIAAILGFGGIAGAAAGIAKLLFFVFVILLIISAVANAVRGRPPV